MAGTDDEVFGAGQLGGDTVEKLAQNWCKRGQTPDRSVLGRGPA